MQGQQFDRRRVQHPEVLESEQNVTSVTAQLGYLGAPPGALRLCCEAAAASLAELEPDPRAVVNRRCAQHAVAGRRAGQGSRAPRRTFRGKRLRERGGQARLLTGGCGARARATGTKAHSIRSSRAQARAGTPAQRSGGVSRATAPPKAAYKTIPKPRAAAHDGGFEKPGRRAAGRFAS